MLYDLEENKKCQVSLVVKYITHVQSDRKYVPCQQTLYGQCNALSKCLRTQRSDQEAQCMNNVFFSISHFASIQRANMEQIYILITLDFRQICKRCRSCHVDINAFVCLPLKASSNILLS